MISWYITSGRHKIQGNNREIKIQKQNEHRTTHRKAAKRIDMLGSRVTQRTEARSSLTSLYYTCNGSMPAKRR